MQKGFGVPPHHLHQMERDGVGDSGEQGQQQEDLQEEGAFLQAEWAVPEGAQL
jgi:hypothetical protein